MSIRITNNIDLSCKECKKLEQENARLREQLSKAVEALEDIYNDGVNDDSKNYSKEWHKRARLALENIKEKSE